MTNRFFHRGLFLALAILFLEPGSLPAQKLLRMKFEAGEKRRVTSRIEAESGYFGLERAIQVKSQWTVDATVTTQAVGDDHRAEQTVTIDRVRVKRNFSGVDEAEYDSASQEEPGRTLAVLADQVRPAIGEAMTQTIDSRGRITDVKISEAVEQARNSIEQRSRFYDVVNQFPIEFPEQAVSEGESWKVEPPKRENTILGTAAISITFTYLGEETVDGVPLDKIEMKTDIRPQPFENLETLPPSTRVKDQRFTGTIWLHPGNGQVVRTITHHEISMETVLEEAGGMVKVKAVIRTEAQPVEP